MNGYVERDQLLYALEWLSGYITNKKIEDIHANRTIVNYTEYNTK